MYLHLGGQTVVKTENIVAILDLETTSVSKKTKEFLKINEKNGVISNISDDIPKSYVICNEEGAVKIYISQLSSSTLLKRTEQPEQSMILLSNNFRKDELIGGKNN